MIYIPKYTIILWQRQAFIIRRQFNFPEFGSDFAGKPVGRNKRCYDIGDGDLFECKSGVLFGFFFFLGFVHFVGLLIDQKDMSIFLDTEQERTIYVYILYIWFH